VGGGGPRGGGGGEGGEGGAGGGGGGGRGGGGGGGQVEWAGPTLEGFSFCIAYAQNNKLNDHNFQNLKVTEQL